MQMFNELEIGKEYTNKELSMIFSCSPQGGMRVSLKNKTVAIISVLKQRKENNPYKDSLINEDGCFVYTGMGTRGDQIVNKTNQNGKVAYAKALGYRIFYFVSNKSNTYKFMGEAVNNGEHYFVDEVDVDGNLRKVVKFPLKLIK